LNTKWVGDIAEEKLVQLSAKSTERYAITNTSNDVFD